MHLALSQLPDQPGINRSKQQFTVRRPLPCTIHMIQDPCQLASRKIRIRNQTGAFPDSGFFPPAFYGIYHLRCSPALPHNGWIYRLSGVSVPDDRSFPLIRNTDRRNISGVNSDFPMASVATLSCEDHISIGSCSTHPGFG